MSFLELGFMLVGAGVGLLLSFAGVGAQPSWTMIFVAQILASITILPLAVCLVAAAILSSLSDEDHLRWIWRLTLKSWN